ncbi:MAG: ABC transporter ATP-binding protein [Bacteroidetes bacterium]|nr:ABC transporter ATP-binding protein [Bacteroidota bacterium]
MDILNTPNPLARLFPYLLTYRNKLLLGLLFVLLTNLFNVLGPLLIGSAIDRLKSDFSSAQLVSYGLLIILMAAGRGLFLFMVRQTIIVVSRDCEQDIRNDLYQHIQRLSTRYYKTRSTGDILARNTNDLNAIRSFLGPGIMYSANTLATFLFIIPIMAYVNWELTLVALLPLPVMSYMVFRMGKSIHHQYTHIQSHYSSLTTRVQENLSGIRVVKAYVREAWEIMTFTRLNRTYMLKNLRLVRYQALFYSLMSLLIGLSVVLVVWYGGSLVIAGKLTLGEMTQFVIFVGMLIWPMIALGWVINIIQQASASQKRINEILDEVPEVRDTPQTDPEIQSVKGFLTFKSVSFGYQPDRPVLKDISFSVTPGQVLAVTGETGSGKSTLVNLVMRLFDPDSGTILMDGRPLREIPLKVLRKHIGYVPQDTFLFSDTIANNIGFGVESAGEEEIRLVADLASIRENIEDFPQRYDTFVGERGITLSGGQKQRTAIARALLRKPSVLILDDSLSAVDTQTEDLILNRLKEHAESRLTIIVSHRISAIRNATHILVLSGGEVVEQGTHSELLAANGLYAATWEKQKLEDELKAIT